MRNLGSHTFASMQLTSQHLCTPRVTRPRQTWLHPSTRATLAPSSIAQAGSGRSRATFGFHRNLRQATASASSTCSRCQATVGSALEAAAPDGDVSDLEDLLVWLVRNGVSGIGSEDSKVALYEDDAGKRGILCDQDIQAGEVVLRVPLRLAVTDVFDPEQQELLGDKVLLPQDRLVCKLLLEVAKGRSSPWHAYIKALPKEVPCALLSFTDADAALLECPHIQQQLQELRGQLQRKWEQLEGPAVGGCSWSVFQWAHSVVMSRTFGNAGKQGGIGVRMLVPLIDLLNHAGDETAGLLGEEPVARDSVRWDVVSPQNSASGAWEMVLSAKCNIAAGQPLALSYFEGSNDEFLMHYGFVPPSNPHDTVVLYSNLASGLEAAWWADVGSQRLPVDELRQLYSQALEVGLQVLQEEVLEAAAGGSGADDNMAAIMEMVEPVKVASGCRLSNPYMAALDVIAAGDAATANLLVATACWQALQAMATPLLLDLALLLVDSGELQEPGRYSRLLEHYSQCLLLEHCPELAARLTALQSCTHGTPSSSGTCNDSGSQSSSSSSSSSSTLQNHSEDTLGFSPKKKKMLGPIPGPWQSSTAASEAEGLGMTAAGPAAAAGASTVPASIGQLLQASDAASLAKALLMSPAVKAAYPRLPQLPLSAKTRSAVMYRANKKQLLWDVVVATEVGYGKLASREEAAAGAAARGTGALPPWG